jgi:hypothetical protein
VGDFNTLIVETIQVQAVPFVCLKYFLRIKERSAGGAHNGKVGRAIFILFRLERSGKYPKENGVQRECVRLCAEIL